MNKSEINDEYVKRFQEVATLLLFITPSASMIKSWYNDPNVYELQEFCVNHDMVGWSTGIGIIKAIEHMIEEARNNTNLNADWSIP